MKWIAGILLLPICVGVTNTLVRVIGASGRADTIWAAMLAGAACWLVIYILLPKPMWVYVFGHELTHVIWTWLFGGRVKRFKVTSRGGHVRITKSNFVIALAPYFFPVYTMMVGLIFLLGHMLWDWRRFALYFHFLLGASYAFHLTLTWRALQVEQTDITEHGYWFSGMIIWLGNMLVLIFGIALVTGQAGMLTVISWCWIELGKVFGRLGALF